MARNDSIDLSSTCMERLFLVLTLCGHHIETQQNGSARPRFAQAVAAVHGERLDLWRSGYYRPLRDLESATESEGFGRTS